MKPIENKWKIHMSQLIENQSDAPGAVEMTPTPSRSRGPDQPRATPPGGAPSATLSAPGCEATPNFGAPENSKPTKPPMGSGGQAYV
jgi:hypothetical protein